VLALWFAAHRHEYKKARQFFLNQGEMGGADDAILPLDDDRFSRCGRRKFFFFFFFLKKFDLG